MAFCETLKLEKGMYNVAGQSFTKVLEKLDPSENYKGTELEGLDAYQRQLKRFDIKVSGPGCDTIEKFFSTPDSAVLFPEFIARAVKQGMTSSSVLPSITAANSNSDGLDFRPISLTLESGLANVIPGNEMRTVSVLLKGKSVSLLKHGRVFSGAYEAMRSQNLDVVAIFLKQIGADIASEQLVDAITALLTGDGTTPDKATEISAATAGTLTYADLITLWGSLSPYNLSGMIANVTTMKDILGLAEMKDAHAGLNFQGTGKLITPIGSELIVAPSLAGLGNKKIIGFDKEFALQMIKFGEVDIDYDKVIDRQLERAGVSVISGFSRIFKDAVKVLTY